VQPNLRTLQMELHGRAAGVVNATKAAAAVPLMHKAKPRIKSPLMEPRRGEMEDGRVEGGVGRGEEGRGMALVSRFRDPGPKTRALQLNANN
jgi:hypothetical protein